MCRHFVQGWICLAALLSGVNARAGYAPSSCCGPTSGCCQRALEESPWQEGTPPSGDVPPGQAPDMSAAAGAGAAAGGFGGGAFASGPGGYIDPAVVANRFRIRYDNMQDADRPDRAEFLYSHQVWQNATNITSVDLQELNVYFEAVVTCGVSVFVELPVRWVDYNNGAGIGDDSGFGDVNFGVRAALYECCGDYLTFQLKVYAPTGDEDTGLGTGHTTIEPGLLFQRQVASDTIFFGETRLWIPTDGTRVDDDTNDNGNFTGTVAGTVFRYGVGISYDLWEQCCRSCNCCGCGNRCCGCGSSCCGCGCGCPSRLSAVVELVGWTVLDGGKGVPGGGSNGGTTDSGAVVSADGDTIINLKIGARYTSGPHSFYGGWGHALTGDVWYEDIARAEYCYTY